jgi:polyisoprenoid-binding protein YceI
MRQVDEMTARSRVALAFLLAAAIAATPSLARAEMVRYVVDPAQCDVLAVVAQPLSKFRGDAIGAFRVRSGEVTGNAANPSVGANLRLVIDASSYSSGNSRRDSVVTGTLLDSANYPDITFVSTGVKDLAIDTPGEGSALIIGDLTVRGQTQSINALVSVALIGRDRLEARGEVTFRYSRFGIAVPRMLGMVHASDEVTVKYRIVANRAAR